MAKHDRGVVNGRAFRSGGLALLAAPLAVEAPRAGSRGRLTPSDLEVGEEESFPRCSQTTRQGVRRAGDGAAGVKDDQYF
jgi:hypothetical protein